MAQTALALDDVVSQVASHTFRGDDVHTATLLDPETGHADGMLVESLLERIAIFVHAQDSLSLSDLSHVRRVMARAQARRAYLFVLATTAVQKPVELLATLSKIRIVRVEAPRDST